MADVAEPGAAPQRICDLVLSGGDVKAIALVGAIQVLMERGYAVNRVAGTSSGSIVAALVAAGYGTQDLGEVMADLDFSRLADRRWPARLIPGVVGYAGAVLVGGTVCRGRYLAQWLPRQLGARGVTSFEQLPPPLPSPELSAPTGRDKLVVVAVDVTSGRLRRLPDAFALYDTELTVADAVRASAAVPFFFPPVRLPVGGVDHVLVDGGIASSLPNTVFDAPPDRAPRWPTFAVQLSGITRPADVVYPTRNLLEFGNAVLSSARSFYDRLSLDLPEVRSRTIGVDVGWYPRLDFDVTPANRARLLEAGRVAAGTFLDTWDEAAYLKERADMADVHRRNEP